MTISDMVDCIESSSKDNMWALIEQQRNPFCRFQLRSVFFKALEILHEHYDMPKDKWEGD